MTRTLDKARDSARRAVAKIDDVATDRVVAHINWVNRSDPQPTPRRTLRRLGRTAPMQSLTQKAEQLVIM